LGVSAIRRTAEPVPIWSQDAGSAVLTQALDNHAAQIATMSQIYGESIPADVADITSAEPQKNGQQFSVPTRLE